MKHVAKGISVFLLIAFLLGFAAENRFSQRAYAAENKGVEPVYQQPIDDSVRKQLGQYTSGDLKDLEATESDGKHLFGDTSAPVALQTMNELGVFAQKDSSDAGRQYTTYKHLNSNAGHEGGESFLQGVLYSNTVESAPNTKERPAVVAADLDGTARKNSTVMLRVNADGEARLAHVKVDNLTGKSSGSFAAKGSSLANSKKDFLEYFDSKGKMKRLQNEDVAAWSMEGLYQIVAGNFDNVSGDEIAVYIPTLTGAPRVEIMRYDKASGAFTNWKTLELSYYDSSAAKYGSTDDALNAMTVVSLEAGDIDKDGVDDLIVTAGRSGANGWWKKTEARVYILDQQAFGQSGQQITVPNERVFRLDFKANAYLSQEDELHRQTAKKEYEVCLPTASIGDVDGDGYPELFVAGRVGDKAEQAISDDAYFINYIKYDYEKKTYGYGGDWQTVERSGNIYMPTTYNLHKVNMGSLVTTACFNPQGNTAEMVGGETLFVEGLLFTWSPVGVSVPVYPKVATNSVGGFIQDPTRKEVWMETSGDQLKWIEQAVVGNFDGNPAGREQIAYIYGKTSWGSGGYYYDIGYYNGNRNGNIGSSEIFNVRKSVGEGAFVSIAAPDVLNDSCVATYQRKYPTLTDPEVIAVLVSPPYFEDVDNYLGGSLASDCSTTLDQTKGGGSSHTVGASLTASAYVGFRQALTVFIKIGEAGGTFAGTGRFTYEHSFDAQKEYTISFETKGGTDAVVLLSSKVMNYEYQLYQPSFVVTQDMIDSNGGEPVFIRDKTYKAGETVPEYNDTVTYCMPQEPRKSILDVEDYDEIAKTTEGLPVIRGNLIKSELGRPETYLSDVTNNDNMFYQRDGKGGFQQCTSAGKTGVTQGITFQNGSTNRIGFDLSLAYSAYVNLFGAEGGGSVGGGANYGYTNLSFEGEGYNGKVANMDIGKNKSYSFDWLFGARKAKFLDADKNETEVMILDYQVKNVKSVPVARNLYAEGISAKKIRLEWFAPAGKNAGYGYEIWRRKNEASSKFEKVDSIDGGLCEYVDEDLYPSTEYQYYVVTLAGEGNYSVPSKTVPARTLSEGRSPTINGGPDNTAVIVGETASFTIAATPVKGGNSLNYDWYEMPAGSQQRRPMDKNNAELTLSNTAISMNGNRYYCDVWQTVGGDKRSVRSGTAVLTVMEAVPEVSIDLSRPSGKIKTDQQQGDELTVYVTAQTATGKPLAGDIVFMVTDEQTGETKEYNAALGSDGRGEYTVVPEREGTYEVVAKYVGDGGAPQGLSPTVTYVAFGEDPDKHGYLVMECVEGGQAFYYQQDLALHLQARYFDDDTPDGVIVQPEYSSDNTDVIRVGANGELSVVSAGECDITATYTQEGQVVTDVETFTILQTPVSVEVRSEEISVGDQMPAFMVENASQFPDGLFAFDCTAPDTEEEGRYTINAYVDPNYPGYQRIVGNYDFEFTPGTLVID